MLGRPLARPGVLVAASGGHPSSYRAKAPPLAPSTWNRNPCRAVLRVSHWHSERCRWLRVEATYCFAHGASARFRRYRKTSQSTSAARVISRTASVIPNTNAQVLNSSTVALLACALRAPQW